MPYQQYFDARLQHLAAGAGNYQQPRVDLAEPKLSCRVHGAHVRSRVEVFCMMQTWSGWKRFPDAQSGDACRGAGRARGLRGPPQLTGRRDGVRPCRQCGPCHLRAEVRTAASARSPGFSAGSRWCRASPTSNTAPARRRAAPRPRPPRNGCWACGRPPGAGAWIWAGRPAIRADFAQRIADRGRPVPAVLFCARSAVASGRAKSV